MWPRLLRLMATVSELGASRSLIANERGIVILRGLKFPEFYGHDYRRSLRRYRDRQRVGCEPLLNR